MKQASVHKEASLAGILNWTHDVRLVGQQGAEISREATPAELAAVAAALGVLACDHLGVRYTLRAAGKTRYLLTGVIDLAATQACVVTLEPVTARSQEEFTVELWPSEDVPAVASGVVDDLDSDDIEPIDNGLVDIGRIVLENAACMIDPYPRKADAAFSWVDQAAEALDSGNPFAKLRELKS